ncbi:MAG: UvrD-helicase domain-containing protein [Treponema sp.]|jgi:ATP-dependent helicase/nuclease subunit A|nr:UvrD-helicase domain-containing protein [Treponema sp.]
MKFDPNQQVAYLADMNAAVSAGAGSGKTTVLAERYVRLVTERGFKVNEVLTLTFTRKAAAEMRERIFKRLSASEHPLAKEALTQFDQARISTLDSFCSSLVRGASYRYGIAGDFRVDDSELAAIAEETAVEIIMRERNNAGKIKTISRLVSSRSFESIVKDLFAALAAASFSLVKQDNYAALARKQVSVVLRETKACVNSINRCCQKISALDDTQSKSETLRKAKEAARKTIPIPPNNEDFNEAFSDEYLARLIETGDFFASSKSYTTPKSNVKDEALIELREITVGEDGGAGGGAYSAAGLKDAAKKLIVLAKTLQFREDMLVIGETLDAYKEKFIEKKRQAGLLSFHDTLEMSVDVLLNDLGLRNFYKRRIKAIMIDEFQDNNELQKQLLYLLSEKDDAGAAGSPPETGGLHPNKLFFVGDEKQSIYRFRGADVAVFRGLSGELQSGGISLNTNYRSTPELVKFFNMIFPAVFGQAKEKFEAEFFPAESAPHKKTSTIKPVEIYVQETKRGDKDAQGANGGVQKISKDLSEALCVAERVVKGVDSGEFAFHDVAVLFRSTSHQSEYERVFREANIPFVAADPRGVYAEAPANDFYALLRLALHPLDRNAYATVLRSPFVKLGDESVFRVLLEHPDTPFPDAFSEFHFANDAEKARFDHGKHVFDALQARVDLEPISSILTFLWYETGYRTFMLSHEATRPNAGHFDYLYNLALVADQRQLSVSAFLNELAPLVGTTAKTETGEVPDVENEALFLTVHKSKGLEFPVVVLAGAGGSGQGDRNNAPYYLSKEFGPIINMKSDTQGRNEAAVNYFYDKEKAHIQKQEEAEIKRLFYVAATRAERSLFIFGSRAITARLEHALAEGGEDNRVETLVKLPSPSNSDEARSRSFFDLLALGLSGADAKHGEEDDSPQTLYDVFSIQTPDYAEYHERIKRLHRQTERLLKDQAGVAPDANAFYATQVKPLSEPKTLFTTPTLMEDAGLFSHPAGVQGWLGPLPNFRCDDFLKEDEARGKKFGTLCHRIIERLFSGAYREEKNPAGDSAEVFLSAEESLHETRRLFPDESAARARALSDEASAVAKRFFASDLGKEASKAARRASEFPFLLPMPCGKDRIVIIQGQIDLMYEINGQCVIIDFKTDAEVRPQNHRFQLACYTRAAPAFSDLSPRVALVYLRNMRAVEFDPAISDEEFARVGREAANRTILEGII